MLGTSALSLDMARRIVGKQAPDEYLAAEAIELFVERLYFAIERDGKRIESWTSIGQHHFVHPMHKWLVWRNEVRQAVDYYINGPDWIKHPYFDWLCANTLLFSEAEATHEALGVRPIWWGYGGNIQWGLLSLAFGWRLFKFVAWLAVLLAAILSQVAVAPWAWLTLTAIVQVTKFWSKSKRAKLLTSMTSAYETTNTSTVSWTNVWDHLISSRDAGAVWDPELFALVESRKI